jgi:hypothetical protein
MSLNVKVRLVNGEAFPVSVPADSTTLALKQAIEAARGAEAFPVGGQKIVCSGKVLADDASLAAAGVKEDGFVVCMVTKPKVRRAAAAATRPRAMPRTPRALNAVIIPAVLPPCRATAGRARGLARRARAGAGAGRVVVVGGGARGRARRDGDARADGAAVGAAGGTRGCACGARRGAALCRCGLARVRTRARPCAHCWWLAACRSRPPQFFSPSAFLLLLFPSRARV